MLPDTFWIRYTRYVGVGVLDSSTFVPGLPGLANAFWIRYTRYVVSGRVPKINPCIACVTTVTEEE